MIEINEGIVYREKIWMAPSKKVIDKSFELRQKYKDEKKGVIQLLVKLFLNSLYGELAGKDIEQSYECKSELWMMTEFDERVLSYQKNNDGT